MKTKVEIIIQERNRIWKMPSYIKTPFLSSVMPYMVSPKDIQKKKISISTGNEDKEGNMPKSQELDPDIRLRQMRNSYF